MLPAAVLFDMDGLMFDSERVAQRAWQHALGEYGFPFIPDVYTRVIGRTLEDAREIMLRAYGPDLPIDAIHALRHLRADEELHELGVPLKPGLLALLESLERLGIPKVMATSTGRTRALWILERAGMINRFQGLEAISH